LPDTVASGDAEITVIGENGKLAEAHPARNLETACRVDYTEVARIQHCAHDQ